MLTLTNGDEELIQLCNEINGVCFSNVKGYRMKKAPFFVGEGDTGKSQLKSLVEKLLGKGNFASLDLKDIEARFGTGGIYGMRLAGSSDMSFLSVDELKTFKKTTGGDSLFAEFKGQQSFEFTYNGLLWFCMNKLPKFGGDDGKWVYDRIMVIECNNVIPLKEQDKRLLEKMYEEREGIVFQGIMALKQVIKNGYRFSEASCVTNARALYMTENSTVISFYNECMMEREENKITDNTTTGKVYDVYKMWCNDNNNGYAKQLKNLEIYYQIICVYPLKTPQSVQTRELFIRH